MVKRKRDIGGEIVGKSFAVLSYPVGIVIGTAILKQEKGYRSLTKAVKDIHNAYVKALKTPLYYKTKKLEKVV